MQFLHLLVLVLVLPLSSPSSLSSDIQSLLSFKNASDPFNHLHSWSPLSSSPCSSWLGISCSSSSSSSPRITHLILQNLSLSGAPSALSLLLPLSHLRVLSLNSNSISGPIPPNLPSSLRLLFLSHNNLSGHLPFDLLSGQLPRLSRLDLSFNHLSGTIPFSNSSHLLTLRLNSNNFTGNLPASFHFPRLQDLNLSSNSLSGPIPASLSSFPASSFSQNSASLCGSPLPGCKNFTAQQQQPSKPRTNNEASAVVSSSPVSKPVAKPSSSNGGSRGGISRMAVIAIVVGDFAILVMVSGLLFCYFWRKFAGRSGSRMQESEKIVYSSSGAVAAASSMTAMAGGGGFERGKMVFFEGTRRFELEDLLRASAEMLGKGGYGTAYKAVLDDGNVVAVKRLREVGDGSCAGVVTRREFEAQMEVIGKLRHGNLVALKAYYYARDEKLLVYDYMPGGSLFALLHGQYYHSLSSVAFSLFLFFNI